MSSPSPLSPRLLDGWSRQGGWVFDLDGTLLDIAPRPDAVEVPPSLLSSLSQLSNLSAGRVAIVSGRALADLVHLIPLPSIALVGNHGAERRINGHVNSVSPPSEGLNAIRSQLNQLPTTFPGLVVEDKDWTISVHVRHVAEHRLGACEAAIRDIASRPDLYLRAAKACWEIGPKSGASKGDAVRWLSEHWGTDIRLAIFGDDVTDEDAFHAARPHDLTVIIGSRRPTQAKFSLPSPDTLRRLIKTTVS
ncbi:trehalose-phosphatase [Sulfobacillus harzensis]|uniref:Trehalose 6-phosphate phosphatase n=1 Tax=Sulfobacillus harzensis TaxID=2729629 RepID=A0A7Y0L535_9FIRM|nr:trehalose-phosphatase [Sulfobacillus harzensis]NMP23474.1 trehalose-phosphatase [Sulfobacillus harzensis]